MKIEKGIVRDQGYPDYELTYGVLEDNTQYFFVANGTLYNGNIIASTVLKEAIGHAKNTSLGLIDSEGKVIIPFINKILKVVNEDYLLVEKEKPESPKVLEALGLRGDPLAATRLVGNAAAIKEKVVANMEPTGRFIFNDQFSEAAIYDLAGNNIMGDEYFSFIGLDEKGFYFFKNDSETDIVTYKFNNEEETIEEPVVPEIDVANLPSDLNIVEDAISEITTEEEPSEVDISFEPEEIKEIIEEPIENSNLKEEKIIDEEYTPLMNMQIKDSIMEDVAGTMKRLIQQNKTQRETLIDSKEEISTLREESKMMQDKNLDQTREISSLKDKLEKYESMLMKLEGKTETLSTQLTDMSKDKEKLLEEVKILRPQVAGKEQLANLLEVANETLEKY